MTVLEARALAPGPAKSLGGVRGLYLRKTTARSGFYFLRYTLNGARHEFGLGSYPDVSLAKARELAREARSLLNDGIDPIEAKAARGAEIRRRKAEEEVAANPVTLRMVAEEWLAARAKANHWKHNPRGEQTTRSILERHAYPVIGEMPVEDIGPEDVLRCLEPLWQEKHTTGRKVKTYLSGIFRWAMAKGLRKDQSNPASLEGALGVLLEPYKNGVKASENRAACAVADLPRLMKEIDAYWSSSARALEFAILTASRSQAVRLATWDEFDLERGVWTVPLAHDKVKAPGRDRTVFLSKPAIALLKSLPRFAGDQGIVFQSAMGSALSSMALEMFMRGLHEKKLKEDGIGWIDPVKSRFTGRPCPISPHGTCRATFRTWAKDDEIGNNRRFDQEAVELCLLHSKNDGYNGAYDRARLEKERRAIMEAWGEYACSLIASGAEQADISGPDKKQTP